MCDRVQLHVVVWLIASLSLFTLTNAGMDRYGTLVFKDGNVTYSIQIFSMMFSLLTPVKQGEPYDLASGYKH